MTQLVNNPGQVQRIWLAKEVKPPYVTADKTLMVAAEIKAVRQDSTVETSLNVWERASLLKLCPLFADTYGREGDRRKKRSLLAETAKRKFRQ